MTVLLDTHVLHWWSAEPQRLSAKAAEVVSSADELSVCGITWYELAWLAAHERITLTIPVERWLAQLSAQVRTVGVTPAIARSAVDLPGTFPQDPADRLIYATAVERGWPLISKDRALRRYKHPAQPVVW